MKNKLKQFSKDFIYSFIFIYFLFAFFAMDLFWVFGIEDKFFSVFLRITLVLFSFVTFLILQAFRDLYDD